MYDDIIIIMYGIVREMNQFDAFRYMRRMQSQNVFVGRKIAEHNKARIQKARNAFHASRMNVNNKKLAVLRHRTHQ